MTLVKRFSLRIAIQTIFIATFIFLITSVSYLYNSEFSQSIYWYSQRLMEKTCTEILKEIQLEINPASDFNRLTQKLLGNNMVNPREMVDYTYYVAKSLPIYQLKYPERITAWGDAQGNSVETSLEPDGTFSTAVIIPNNTPPISKRLFRNQLGQIIKSEPISSKYDPRLRPWYLAAQDAKQLTWTDIFYSYPYKNLSVASVIPIYDKQNKQLGVFEVEIKLLGLSDFLSTLKFTANTELFILNNKNELVVYEGMQRKLGKYSENIKRHGLISSGRSWLVKSMEIHNQTQQDYFKFDYNQETYLAYFKTIPEFASHGIKIGIVTPEDDFMGPLKKTKLRVNLVSLVLILVGIMLTRFFSKRITRPLNLVVKDTERIKNFQLDKSEEIHSYISEIILLTKAMESMKANLKSFQKYVPTDLVRQLIRSGKDVKVGGTKRLVTSFFSDIRNFTNISQHMEAEALMAHLCEYLEELSQIITNEKGTIDKFIGDSIMAFWGAPLADEQHCIHACRAALKCQARLHELNQQWQKQNKPPLITGIGLHVGPALIGNIGSSTRLNYTAIGDTINLASRLESLSKNYGSVIIVSEAVVLATQEEFVFRFIEEVSIRGISGSHKIYELVSFKEKTAITP